MLRSATVRPADRPGFRAGARPAVRVGVGVLAIAAAFALAGCQGTTSPAPTAVKSTDLTSSDGGFDENAVIGVVLRASAGGAGSAADAGSGERFRSALTDAGFRPDVRVADADGEAAAQRRAVHAVVRAGAKAVLVDAVDPASLAAQVRYAHDAGVVVVALGEALPGSAASSDGGVDADYRVSADSEEQAVSRAVRVVESLQRGEKPRGSGVTAD